MPDVNVIRWKKTFEEEQHLYKAPQAEAVESVRRLPSTERQICMDCVLWINQMELASSHAGHNVKTGITDTQLRHPTSILCPVDNRKSQAVSYLYHLL